MLLALGPRIHLESADGDEGRHSPVPARNNDAYPGQNLEHVVGASHKIEAEAPRDLALRAAARPKAGKVQMDRSIADLAEEVDEGSHKVDDGNVGLGGEGGWAVEGVGAKKPRDGPVEEAVLEDVEGGHGVGRELVHEDRLKLALDEVQYDHAEGEPLRV